MTSSPKRIRVNQISTSDLIKIVKTELSVGNPILFTEMSDKIPDVVFSNFEAFDFRTKCRLRRKNNAFEFEPLLTTRDSLFWSFFVNSISNAEIYECAPSLIYELTNRIQCACNITIIFPRQKITQTKGWCLTWCSYESTNYRLKRHDQDVIYNFGHRVFLKDIKNLPRTNAQFLTLYMSIELNCDFRIIDSIFFHTGCSVNKMKYRIFTFGMEKTKRCRKFTVTKVG